MRKYILALILLLSSCIYNHLEARGVIIYHNGPTIDVVKNLPQDLKLDGHHVNLGVMYDQFGLFWLPVWNYGTPRYVLISDNEETYWDLDDDDLEIIRNEYNVDFSETPEPTLWNKVGLKPIILILIVFFIWTMLAKKEHNTEDESQGQAHEQEQPKPEQPEAEQEESGEEDESDVEDEEYEEDEEEEDEEEENNQKYSNY